MKVVITNPAVQKSQKRTQVPNNPTVPCFAFDNTYARELEGFYVPWKAAQAARPFDDQPEFAAFAAPAPDGQGRYQTFCGT